MKKSLLAIVVGALAVASTANAGLYAEGDLGLSRTKLTNGGSSKTKIEPRVAVGYKLGNVRVAGDYTHHGNFQGTKVQGLGATGFRRAFITLFCTVFKFETVSRETCTNIRFNLGVGIKIIEYCRT